MSNKNIKIDDIDFNELEDKISKKNKSETQKMSEILSIMKELESGELDSKTINAMKQVLKIKTLERKQQRKNLYEARDYFWFNFKYNYNDNSREFVKDFITSSKEKILNNSETPDFDHFNEIEEGPRGGIKEILHHDVIAEWIIRVFDVIKYEGFLYYKNLFVKEDKLIFKPVDAHGTELKRLVIELNPSLKESVRKEIWSYINQKTSETNRKIATHSFVTKDGSLYELESESGKIVSYENIENFEKNEMLFNRLGANYIPGYKRIYKKEYDFIDNFLNTLSLQRPGVKNEILQMFAICLIPSLKFEMGFILLGKGSNGKSTLFNFFKSVLGGIKNFSALSMHEVETQFSSHRVKDKLVNIGADISNNYLKSTEVIKNLVTGDSIEFEKKGMDKKTGGTYAKFIFAANSMPRTSDKSGGWTRRWRIIPFNANFEKMKKFKVSEKDNFSKQLYIDIFFSMLVDKLQELELNNKKMDTIVLPASVETETEMKRYQTNNNPILEYFLTHLGWSRSQIKENLLGKFTQDIWNDFREWTFNEGMEIKKRNLFEFLLREFDLGKEKHPMNRKMYFVDVKPKIKTNQKEELEKIFGKGKINEK